jgi:hypothetical protein
MIIVRIPLMNNREIILNNLDGFSHNFWLKTSFKKYNARIYPRIIINDGYPPINIKLKNKLNANPYRYSCFSIN